METLVIDDYTTEVRGRDTDEVVSSARAYIERGWAPIPIRHGTKVPERADWTRIRVTTENLAEYFDGQPQNVGLLLGEASDGLVDVDLDAPEAVAVAATFLPRTSSVFGRAGKRSSHRLYVANPIPEYEKFVDVDGTTCLVELRSTGHQTMVPPSVHPSSERVEWVQDGEPGGVDGLELDGKVRLVAAAALLARHWPARGSRHDAANALAGGLLRADWSEEDVERFVYAVAQAAGDEEAHERPDGVATTVRRLADGGPATG